MFPVFVHTAAGARVLLSNNTHTFKIKIWLKQATRSVDQGGGTFEQNGSDDKNNNNTKEVPKEKEPGKDTVPHPQRPQKKKEKSTKKNLLVPGTLLKGKYEIDGLIGSGGYGQIYKATNVNREPTSVDPAALEVAVKVMLKEHEPQRMVLEQNVLMDLRKSTFFPKLLTSGKHCTSDGKEVFFLVIELLGPNLSDLRKQKPLKKLDKVTCYRVGIQCVISLKVFHQLGYVHRDIKPANMCCGREGVKIRKVYIIDFGLVRKSRDRNGKYITRTYAGFRGTMRYVSINVHERKDQCAVDDLISLYYTICELADGVLPWSRCKDQDQVFNLKNQKGPLSKSLPESFTEFYTRLRDAKQPHEPDYDQLLNILKKNLPDNFDENSPYEWEEFYLGGSLSTPEHAVLPSKCASHVRTMDTYETDDKKKDKGGGVTRRAACGNRSAQGASVSLFTNSKRSIRSIKRYFSRSKVDAKQENPTPTK